MAASVRTPTAYIYISRHRNNYSLVRLHLISSIYISHGCSIYNHPKPGRDTYALAPLQHASPSQAEHKRAKRQEIPGWIAHRRVGSWQRRRPTGVDGCLERDCLVRRYVPQVPNSCCRVRDAFVQGHRCGGGRCNRNRRPAQARPVALFTSSVVVGGGVAVAVFGGSTVAKHFKPKRTNNSRNATRAAKTSNRNHDGCW